MEVNRACDLRAYADPIVTEELDMEEKTKTAWKTFTEELDVAGHQLVAEINRVLAEGNVRKLQVRTENGDIALSLPLTACAVAGGVVVLAAPWLAIIAAVAGVVAKIKIEVVREIDPKSLAGASESPAGPSTTAN
jgi:Domain of unknown function (DUF4342)